MADDPENSQEQTDDSDGIFGLSKAALDKIGPIKNQLLGLLGMVAALLSAGLGLIPAEHRIWAYCALLVFVLLGLLMYVYLTLRGYTSIQQAQLQAQTRMIKRRIPRRRKSRRAYAPYAAAP